MSEKFTCADCPKPCRTHDMDKLPVTCPTREYSESQNLDLYTTEELKMAHNAALVESAGYCRHTRLEEIMSFSYRMGYKKLGLGFCVGCSNEARILTKILKENQFEVAAVCCKCGSVSKEKIDIRNEQQLQPGRFEPMCNPARQAEYLDQQNTDLNILLGLCVGHDSIFIKHSKAPVTVFAAKDRALAHNPMGALYLSDSYLKRVHTFIKDNFTEQK